MKVAGDGAPLPSNVIVLGLEVTGEGTYDLIDALVQSNGDLRVIVDGGTRVVPAVRQEETSRSDLLYV